MSDPDVQLLLPTTDVAEPELSIVIPALNEELTIADFVAWCHAGMKAAGVVGEILIVDSGSDRTTERAAELNALIRSANATRSKDD